MWISYSLVQSTFGFRLASGCCTYRSFWYPTTKSPMLRGPYQSLYPTTGCTGSLPLPWAGLAATSVRSAWCLPQGKGPYKISYIFYYFGGVKCFQDCRARTRGDGGNVWRRGADHGNLCRSHGDVHLAVADRARGDLTKMFGVWHRRHVLSSTISMSFCHVCNLALTSSELWG